MSEIFVNHLSFALGEESNSVEEAAAHSRILSNASALKGAGFQYHHICRRGTTAYDLAKRAVQGIPKDLGVVGAIVYATCIPANGNIGNEGRYRETRDVKHLMDFPASHLQSDFGMTKAVVFGLNQQACTGMLGSLRLARSILLTEPHIECVLCVTADRFPDGALYEQSYNLISDGAAACLVSSEPDGFRLVTCHGVTNGGLAGASDDETVGNYFSYAHRVIRETLEKANLEMGDIDWIIPQNTNTKAWQILSHLLPFDFDRVVFPTIGEVGHVISSDNIINLRCLWDGGKIQSRERVLLFMAGYGLNWQCVILERW